MRGKIREEDLWMPDIKLPVITEKLEEFRRPPNKGIDGNFKFMCDMYQMMTEEERESMDKWKEMNQPAPVKFKLID